jgi:hypothetical protein
MLRWQSFLSLLTPLSLPHLLIAAPFVLLWLVLQRIQEVDISRSRFRLRFLGHRENKRGP